MAEGIKRMKNQKNSLVVGLVGFYYCKIMILEEQSHWKAAVFGDGASVRSQGHQVCFVLKNVPKFLTVLWERNS